MEPQGLPEDLLKDLEDYGPEIQAILCLEHPAKTLALAGLFIRMAESGVMPRLLLEVARQGQQLREKYERDLL